VTLIGWLTVTPVAPGAGLVAVTLGVNEPGPSVCELLTTGHAVEKAIRITAAIHSPNFFYFFICFSFSVLDANSCFAVSTAKR
jgi:hypothetical protein